MRTVCRGTVSSEVRRRALTHNMPNEAARKKNTFLCCYPYEHNKHKLSLRVTYVFILLFHHLHLVPPKCLLPFRFPTLKDTYFPVPRRTTCFAHLIILYSSITTTSSEQRAHTHTHTHTHTSTVFRNHTAVSASWPLKMGPIGCTETSVRNFHYSPRNSPEECDCDILCGGSPKSSEWDVTPQVCIQRFQVSPFHGTPHAQPVHRSEPLRKLHWPGVAVYVSWSPYHLFVSGTFDAILQDWVSNLVTLECNWLRLTCHLVSGYANTNYLPGDKINIWDFPGIRSATLWQHVIRDTWTTGYCRWKAR